MSVEVGIVVDGKVSGIREFGAFVQLPDGNTGLVHISEVAEEYIKDIKTYLNENQMVKVKVLSVGDNGKISLSIRKAIDKPVLETTYKVAAQSTQQSLQHAQRQAPYQRPERNVDHRRASFNTNSGIPNFEDMISKFMKDSDERMHDIKRNVESKRGSSRK